MPEEEFEDENKMFAVRGGRWYKVEMEDGLPVIYYLGTPRRLTGDGKSYFETPPVIVDNNDITPEMKREIRRIWRGV